MTQTVQEYFATLPSRVPAQNTAGMTNSYLFEIKKVGSWLVAVDDGKVTVSEGDGDADARITMSEDVFQKLVAGEQNPMRAVMTGKIKVKGSMGAAAKLQKILAPPEGSAEAAAPAMPTKELLREALASRGRRGDDGGLGELLADDVVWYGSAGGDVHGKEQVLERWRSSDGTDVRLGDTAYTDGIHVVMFADVSTAGSAARRQALVGHIDENGKITELWGIPSDRDLAAGGDVPESPVLPAFAAAQEARMRGEFGPDDVAALGDFFDPHVVWHMGGRTGWAQERQGLEAVVGTFQGLNQATGGTFKVEVHELYADDAHAVGFSHLTAERPGHPDKHMDVDEVSLFHLHDGKAYEFWGIPEDEAERDSFWMD